MTAPAPLPQAERVLLIACGALAHEILALKALNGWDHLDLACLPAILHNTPDAIPDAVAQAVANRSALKQAPAAWRADYEALLNCESLRVSRSVSEAWARAQKQV